MGSYDGVWQLHRSCTSGDSEPKVPDLNTRSSRVTAHEGLELNHRHRQHCLISVLHHLILVHPLLFGSDVAANITFLAEDLLVSECASCAGTVHQLARNE